MSAENTSRVVPFDASRFGFKNGEERKKNEPTRDATSDLVSQLADLRLSGVPIEESLSRLQMVAQSDSRSLLPDAVQYTQFLCSRQNQTLIPPVKQSKDHDTQTAARLCLSPETYGYFKKTIPADEVEGTVDAMYYRGLLNTLFIELDFLRTTTQFVSEAIQRQIRQDIILSIGEVAFYNTQFVIGFLSPGAAGAAITLSDSESLAFYLRFNKALEAASGNNILLLLHSQRKLLKRFWESGRPEVVQCIKANFTQLTQNFDSFRLTAQDYSRVFSISDGFMKQPISRYLVRSLAPHFGYLYCLAAEGQEKVIRRIAEGLIDHDIDKENFERQRCHLLELATNKYLDQQIKIYAFAHQAMSRLLQGHPEHESIANFKTFDTNSKVKIYSPQEFERHIRQLKQDIQTQLADLTLFSSPPQQEQRASEKEANEPQAARAAAQVKKTKKKKPKKVEQPRIEVQHQQSAAAAAAAAAPNPNQGIALDRRDYDKAELIAFLKSPVHFHPIKRVRRWFPIEPEPKSLDKIRSFEDTRNGNRVTLYKDLSDEALREQLLFHGFTPLVDRILNDPTTREKYSYKTKSGLGIFVRVQGQEKDSPGINGVLFYGLDQNIYFHRKIDPFTTREIKQLSLSQLVEQSATKVLKLITKKEADESPEEVLKELNSGFNGDTVTVDDYEVLHFIDKKLGCKVSVIPLR